MLIYAMTPKNLVILVTHEPLIPRILITLGKKIEKNS